MTAWISNGLQITLAYQCSSRPITPRADLALVELQSIEELELLSQTGEIMRILLLVHHVALASAPCSLAA